MEKKVKTNITCIFCYEFYKNKLIIVLNGLKFTLIAYLLYTFKQATILKNLGPYTGTFPIHEILNANIALTLASYIKTIDLKVTLISFFISLIIGIESNIYYFDRIEKKYAVFDSMSRYTLTGYLLRVYLFLAYYVVLFSLLTGTLAGIPLHVYSLSSKWLLFGVFSGLLLFLIWLSIFSLTVGIAKDKASGLVIYLLGSFLMLFIENLISKNYSSLYDFISFSTSLISSKKDILMLGIKLYPLSHLIILISLGMVMLSWGIARYEVR